MFRMKLMLASKFVLIAVAFCWSHSIQAQTTAFTYQGRLTDGGMPANGTYDVQFTLWDAATGGTQQPQPSAVTVTKSSVAVSGGVFTVQLDFTVNAFPGADRFLEISVRPAGGATFTTLSPRQQISSTPYAIRTLNAGTADSLSSACVACVLDAQINQLSGSKVNGTIPVASVPTGSGSYIQNTTSLQAGSNFNISGNGIIGGNVGVGITPRARLHVNGTSWFSADTTPLPSAAGSGVAIGFSPGVNAGYIFGFDYTAIAPRNLLLNHPGGNVGIGTTSPTSRLEIAAQDGLKISGFQPFLTLADTSAGSKSAFMQGVGGDALLLTNNRNALVLKDLSGSVGIGTSTPSSRLEVVGSDALKLSGTGVFMSFNDTNTGKTSYIQNINGDLIFVPHSFSPTSSAMVIKNVSGNVGIGNPPTPTARLTVSGAGAFNATGAARFDLYNTTRGDGYLQHALDDGSWQLATINSAATRLLVDPAGNVTQPRDKSGLVKAMVYVNQTGTILRCYNSQVSGAMPCATVDHFTNGGYTVDFGFQISDRFYSVTAQYQGCIGCNMNSGANFDAFTSTSLHIFTFGSGSSDTEDRAFMVIVY
jgi:hypothetical protein